MLPDQVIALARYFELLDETENNLAAYPTLDSLMAAQIDLEAKYPKSCKAYLIYQAIAQHIFDSATDGAAQESIEANYDHFYTYDPYP